MRGDCACFKSMHLLGTIRRFLHLIRLHMQATVVNPPLPASKSWAVRLPSVAFYLFMVVVVASFTANLASLLTVQSFSSAVSNLTDLRQKALPFVVNTGGATYTYFTKSMDPNILLMQAQMRVSSLLLMPFLRRCYFDKLPRSDLTEPGSWFWELL